MQTTNLTKNQQIKLNILDLSYEGLGVAKVDGYSLFVENALPTEQVVAIVTKVGKNFGFAKTIEILRPSADRETQYDLKYLQTGIAPLAHWRYERQLEFKRQQVVNNFAKQKLTIPVKETLGSQDPVGYRNKAQIPIRTVANQATTGFFRNRSHNLVPMEDFLIQDPQIDQAIKQIRDYMRELNIQGYDEIKNNGQIRHIMVRRAYYTREIMIVLVVTNSKFATLPQLLDKIMQNMAPTSLYINVNSKKTNVILGSKFKLVAGQEYITDEILGKKFRISPQSFYQVNPKQTQKLYQLAIDAADLKGNEIVVDAYSGIGTIGLSMADRAQKVIGIEVVDQAVQDAKMNAAINGITNAEFIQGKTEDVLQKWAKEQQKIDVLIVDPPRKGLADRLVQSILALQPQKIVYISCNPATLARDVAALADVYQASFATPVDMFPLTKHVESVTTLNVR
ncbi:23S rRNA (uracil(1939)-C(5))-methyltransferase RlmD [Bombilactobacillus thymidiniphilus]|uniref:23S rRNA (Uracil(1939)-C(5))-methyltransferase RlmD n=1 Tax=Bombilactobacillus thymidiniphilus TaxID=2923363 RepID=A0ABY4PBV6_9LACO|nr:23S rRNA (uracil(1939)-C(5))-methyltransferase RlmD [Bombilactobacillus thymidiniphilus]UQS83239.1 23S rRNA (uracil(1939)-C(5))-methyltransferase RlmD [Bombilactobacillus thymidiniphilus]